MKSQMFRGVSRSHVMVRFAILAGIVSVASPHAARAQTLTAEFETRFEFLRIRVTSTKDTVGNTHTITDTAEYSFVSTTITWSETSFTWFSLQQVGVPYPKIWSGGIGDEHDTLPSEAEASWQTLGNVGEAPGVIYHSTDWQRFSELHEGNPMDYANASTWAMDGGTLPTTADGDSSVSGYTDQSLTATVGVDENFRLSSTVAPGRIPATFIYTYEIVNNTDEIATVSWEAAGIVVDLGPGETYEEQVISRHAGTEARGYAYISAELSGETTLVANALEPRFPFEKPSGRLNRRVQD